MKLISLKIELQRWGDDVGKHKGEVVFGGERGTVALQLDQYHCDRIFEVCAHGLISVAREAAENMTCTVIEHNRALPPGDLK